MKRAAPVDAVSVAQPTLTPRSDRNGARVYYELSSSSLTSDPSATGERRVNENECLGPLHDFTRLLDQSLKRVKISVSSGELRLQRDLHDMTRELGMVCACSICSPTNNDRCICINHSARDFHTERPLNVNSDPYCGRCRRKRPCALGEGVACSSSGKEGPMTHTGGKALTRYPMFLEGNQQNSNFIANNSNTTDPEKATENNVYQSKDFRDREDVRGVKITIERDKLDPLRLKMILGSNEFSAACDYAREDNHLDDWIFLIQVPRKYPYVPPVIYKLGSVQSSTNASPVPFGGVNRNDTNITDAEMLAAATVTAAATSARLGTPGELTSIFGKESYGIQPESVHMEEVMISCTPSCSSFSGKVHTTLQTSVPSAPSKGLNMSQQGPRRKPFTVFEEWTPIHRLHDIVLFLARLRSNAQLSCAQTRGSDNYFDGDDSNLLTCPAFEEDTNNDSLDVGSSENSASQEADDDDIEDESRCSSNASDDYFTHDSLSCNSNRKVFDLDTPLIPKKHDLIFNPSRFDVGFSRDNLSLPSYVRTKIETRCTSSQSLNSAARGYFDDVMDTEKVDDAFLMSCGPLVSSTNTFSKHTATHCTGIRLRKESISSPESTEQKPRRVGAFGSPDTMCEVERWGEEENPNDDL